MFLSLLYVDGSARPWHMFYSIAGVLKPEELSKLKGKEIENKENDNISRGKEYLAYFC